MSKALTSASNSVYEGFGNRSLKSYRDRIRNDALRAFRNDPNPDRLVSAQKKLEPIIKELDRRGFDGMAMPSKPPRTKHSIPVQSDIKTIMSLSPSEREHVAAMQAVLKDFSGFTKAKGPGVTAHINQLDHLAEHIRVKQINANREFNRLDDSKQLWGSSWADNYKNAKKDVVALQSQRERVLDAMQPPAPKSGWPITHARKDSRELDKDIARAGKLDVVGERNYPWGESLKSGSGLLGSGGSGSVMLEPQKGIAVKRGSIGEHEPAIMKKAGEAGLGPLLVSGELDGKAPSGRSYERLGRMAMTVVPGETLSGRRSGEPFSQTTIGESFWEARANLHRLGIAHNDMHGGNVFIDGKGKSRFVDFGLSQDSPKAALAEALGIFTVPYNAPRYPRDGEAAGQGDWQVRRVTHSGASYLEDHERRSDRESGMRLQDMAPSLYQINGNRANVEKKLKEWGLTEENFRTMVDHGIRSPLETYERGVWTKITNKQALELIEILYNGV